MNKYPYVFLELKIMKVADLINENIPTINTDRIINRAITKIETYPKNSLSERIQVMEFPLPGDISYEEAMKIADSLNAEVTKTIQRFHARIKK
jgi:hypothetical protein